ncbi:MAG: alanine racemase [Chlorobi bacterium]|nr:alanine racemase [Chlorobiota bacterium]
MEYKLLRDTFVEVNLDNIKYNIIQVKNFIGHNVAIAAVIKANAYGHGAIQIAPVLIENGADILAVATLSEGLELRNEFNDYEILIMGYTPDSYLEIAVSKNLTLTIFSLKQAKILNKLAKKLNKKPGIHIKYNTGFNRLGYKDLPESINEIIAIINLKNIEVEGIFSHLALKNNVEDKIQYKRLVNAIAKIEKHTTPLKYKHICDSIGTVLHPEYHLTMVRPGAILYGLESEGKGIIDLKQAMVFKTKISHITKLEVGEGISYGYRWTAERKSKIGTIPVGYADGYPRNLYQKGIVTINGKRVPVIGVICMDQCMIDLTDVTNPKVGDEVIIFADGANNTLTVNEISILAGTNKNEIVSRIARRIPRVYIKDKKVFKICDYLTKK